MVLLERDEELRVLDDLLAGLDTTGGKVVLVRGEAGIGKSALVREFTNTHAEDAHIYFGACDDLLTPQPLGPIWDIGREEPSIVDPLDHGDRRAVMEALLGLLSRTLRPTVLVIEDTHWADEATLDVIKYLGRRIARTNGLLLLTYRDGEVDYDHPLRQVIGELPPENLVRVRLDRLSKQAIADLVGDADLDVNEVLALTDGNPLFVTEVLASGVENVPSSVQDSVLARAAKLSTKARQALDLVSVIPGETERFLIDRILGPTEEHMTECARQGLLRVEADTVSFHHELTRRAVESALSASDRRRLNAEVLTELGGLGDLARLVHHAREADDVEAIIQSAPKAARAAMAIGSLREAASHFRTLEPYLDQITETERAAILEDWASTEDNLDNVEALDILTRAIELHRDRGDDLAVAKALILAIRLNAGNGRPEAAHASLTEALAILESYPPSADLAFAVGQQAWLSMLRIPDSDTVELADKAISLAEAVGDELTMIHALNTKGTSMCAFGYPEGFRLLEESRKRAEQAGYPSEECRALINMAVVAAHRLDLKLASDLSQKAIDMAARLELRGHENFARGTYAKVLLMKGEWDTAEDLATDLLGRSQDKLATERSPENVVWRLQIRKGRPEARSMLDVGWSTAGNELPFLVQIATARAEYMWLNGEDDSDQITRFCEIRDEGIRVWSGWEVGELAFWLWELGDASEPPEGIAKPYRLVMEGKPIEAATLWDAMGMPYERALALMHSNEKARLEALEVLETLGATAVAAKLRKALRDDGVTVPRSKSRDTRRHAAGLTARQAEVLQLLAEGLTNIEIADRLFVSPRTVENHVSAVLTKLESSTREDAVFRARDQGLLPAQA